MAIFQVTLAGFRRPLIRWTTFDAIRFVSQDFVFNNSDLSLYPNFSPPRAVSSPLSLPFVLPNTSYAIIVDRLQSLMNAQLALAFGNAAMGVGAVEDSPGEPTITFLNVSGASFISLYSFVYCCS